MSRMSKVTKTSRLTKAKTFARPNNLLFKTTPAPQAMIDKSKSQKALLKKVDGEDAAQDLCRKDPFYLKLCLMNARIKVFQDCFDKPDRKSQQL